MVLGLRVGVEEPAVLKALNGEELSFFISLQLCVRFEKCIDNRKAGGADY
jgi:hypothetical protein